MSNGFLSNRLRGCGGYRFFPVACLWSVLIVWSAVDNLYAVEDDYLKQIEIETEKVEARGLAPSSSTSAKQPNNGVETGRDSEDASGLTMDLSMEGFEQQLNDRFAGSAVF